MSDDSLSLDDIRDLLITVDAAQREFQAIDAVMARIPALTAKTRAGKVSQAIVANARLDRENAQLRHALATLVLDYDRRVGATLDPADLPVGRRLAAAALGPIAVVDTTTGSTVTRAALTPEAPHDA